MDDMIILLFVIFILLSNAIKFFKDKSSKLETSNGLYIRNILFIFITIFIIFNILGFPMLWALILSLYLASLIPSKNYKKSNGKSQFIKYINFFGIKKDDDTLNKEELTKQTDEVKKEKNLEKNELAQNSDTLFQKALELNKLRQYDTSLDLLNKALEFTNDYILRIKIYRTMGEILENRNDMDNALFFYNKAMEISIEFLEDKYPKERYEMALNELEKLGLNKK